MTATIDLAIRMRRAAFNTALANADLAAIGTLLAPNAVLVTGTDSAVLSGRKAQLLTWKREFAASERTTYVRTPDTVTGSPVEPIALESTDVGVALVRVTIRFSRRVTIRQNGGTSPAIGSSRPRSI